MSGAGEAVAVGMETPELRWTLERNAYRMAYTRMHENFRSTLFGLYAALEKELEDREFVEEYPEHAKLEAIPKGRRDAIGEFLEWLEFEGYALCKYQEYSTNGEPAYLDPKTKEPTTYADFLDRKKKAEIAGGRYPDPAYLDENPAFDFTPSGFWPARVGGVEGWLARYYDIDQQALSEEKDQMYRELVKGAR